MGYIILKIYCYPIFQMNNADCLAFTHFGSKRSVFCHFKRCILSSRNPDLKRENSIIALSDREAPAFRNQEPNLNS